MLLANDDAMKKSGVVTDLNAEWLPFVDLQTGDYVMMDTRKPSRGAIIFYGKDGLANVDVANTLSDWVDSHLD